MAAEIPVGVVFVVGGCVILALYGRIFMGQSALKSHELWGYLGRIPRWLWVAVSLVTTVSVLGVFWWLTLGGGAPLARDETALVVTGTLVFMGGAIAWPISVLKGSMLSAKLGVAATAVGAGMLWAYVVFGNQSAPAVVQAAASMMAFHHAVIDGLWAVLPSSPPPPLTTSFL
tara:strand:- start:354 stop:872 length:519 start_codon:yes stop_codon:yes gene_type:complete